MLRTPSRSRHAFADERETRVVAVVLVVAVALFMGYATTQGSGWWFVAAGVLLGSVIFGRWLWFMGWVAIAAFGANPALASFGGWNSASRTSRSPP